MNVLEDCLIGKKVINVKNNLDGITIEFDESCTLNIYVPFKFVGVSESDTQGLEVSRIESHGVNLVIFFGEFKELWINISDEAYTGPEAVYLNCGNRKLVAF